MVDPKNILNKLLTNRNGISSDESYEIQKIIKKYPFFQQAYLLQTIFLRKNNSFHKNMLEETAVRTTNRRRLYEIIELERSDATRTTIMTEKNNDKKETAETKNSTDNKTTDNNKQALLKVSSKTEIKKVITKQKKKEEKTSGQKLTATTEKNKIQVFLSEEELKKISTKSNSGEEVETKKNNPTKSETESIKNKKNAGNKNKPKVDNKIPVKTKKEILPTETDGNDGIKNDGPVEIEKKLSYLEWLRQINSNKKQENKQIFDAIEKFLKERPKIIPQKDKSIEPPDIIEKSVEEKQMLMTETLANLYVKQKKYNKAIQAFKILSLKYPKKSSYFANRIKELKQNLK